MAQQVQVIEKPVYIDRPRIVEKIVERIVEKPVYIDRPVHIPVPMPNQSISAVERSVPVPQMMVEEVNQKGVAVPQVMAQDHHHIIERPVYMEVNRERDTGVATVIRDVEIVERPVYIETPIPVPFERPVPVPVPAHMLQRQQGRAVYERQYGIHNDTFPYHNPYPDMGCDFHQRRLEATNEPDPVRGFLENFKMFTS